jgi:hypothetical protein
MHRLACGVIATVLATPALALDFGNGFSLVGEIGLENVDTDSGGNGFGFADLTASWRSRGDGGLGFGADVTLEAVRLFNTGDNLSVFWGGLVLTTGFGEITVGAPRPILVDFLATPDLAGSSIVEFDFSEGKIGPSLTAAQLLVTGKEIDFYGVSLKGSAGALDYGVGLHQIDAGSGDINVLELGARYRIDRLILTAGAELRDFSTVSGTQELWTVGALYEADRWSIGAQARQAQDPGSDSVTSLRVYGDYAVTEALTIGVQAVDAETLGDTVYGISAQYEVGMGFAGLGYLGGSTEALVANIGLRF